MAVIEIETVTPNCYKECEDLSLFQRPDGIFVCRNSWICSSGVRALYTELLERYEKKQAEAFNKEVSGKKEENVWNEAIRIMEEYIDDEF